MFNNTLVGLIRTTSDLVKNVVKQTAAPQTAKIVEIKVMRDKIVGFGGCLLNLSIDCPARTGLSTTLVWIQLFE